MDPEYTLEWMKWMDGSLQLGFAGCMGRVSDTLLYHRFYSYLAAVFYQSENVYSGDLYPAGLVGCAVSATQVWDVQAGSRARWTCSVWRG